MRSGALNAGKAFDLRATATAAESTYAGIVRLVDEAERQQAPFVRLADRYALVFIPITLVIAGAAWSLSGDPVRALSVLVVATPCPLILAAPIAIVAGISPRGPAAASSSRAAARSRRSPAATVLLFDKTGTLTAGVPQVADVEAFDDGRRRTSCCGWRPRSTRSRRTCSRRRSSAPRGSAASSSSFPADVDEEHGAGIAGRVDGRRIALGKAGYVRGRQRDAARAPATSGAAATLEGSSLRVRRRRRRRRRRPA